MRSLLALALIAAASFSPAPQATTPHFTFHVPVHVTNSPSTVTRVAVTCNVLHGSAYLGSDTVAVPLTGGSFSGTLTVNVNVTVAAGSSHVIDPSLVDRWGCSLIWMLGGRWQWPHYLVNPAGTRGTLAWDAAPGTTVRDIVSGTVP